MLFAYGTKAQDSTATQSGKFTFSGYLDTYYDSNFNKSGVRGLSDAAGLGASVSSITFTGNIIAGDGHLLLKPKLRIDTYSADKFEQNSGTLTPSQTTFGMAAIFKL